MKYLPFICCIALLLQTVKTQAQYATIPMDESVYANFYYTNEGLTVSFINFSLASGDMHWDFDDGYTSDLSDPVHTFPTAGEYHVELTILTNDACIATYTDTIILTYTDNLENAEMLSDIMVYPNPCTTELHIVTQNIVSVFLYDVYGNIMESTLQKTGLLEFTINTAHLETGIYVLALHGDHNIRFFPIFCHSN